MSLTRIQQTFVRLAANNKWGPMGSYRTKRRKLLKYSPSRSQVQIEVIDAVTGEKTSAKAFEESATKLRKWLKLRNVRAEFTNVVLKKKSTWAKLDDMEFIDYPVIIKVGTYKAPYLIKKIDSRFTFKGKTTITIQLETTENIDYLSILSEKKELLKKKKGKK
jgi:hypothetical protein